MHVYMQFHTFNALKHKLSMFDAHVHVEWVNETSFCNTLYVYHLLISLLPFATRLLFVSKVPAQQPLWNGLDYGVAMRNVEL